MKQLRLRAAPLWVSLAILFAAVGSSYAAHWHQTSDGLETALCTCRPAKEEERSDPSLSPDGWMQDEPRASYSRGTVPLPLAPDWVGTRVRATGVLLWCDADRDGDEDLFVGTYYANMYPPIIDYYNFIYRNTGTALESEPSWITPDQRHTTDAAWGRLNGDEHPDLFVANGGQSLHPSQIFFGTAGMLPTTPGWTSNDNCWTIGCALADFDLDGDLDLATANQGNAQNPYRPTYLFRNHGGALESTPSWQSAQVGITNDADWDDMDGDGYPELAVSGWSNWQTGVFRNTGTSLETNFAWTTGQPQRTDKGIGWARVDADALPDLAVGGNGGPNWLFRNEGTMLGVSPVWASQESYHGCQDLKWIDIDRDGDLDLATIHFSTGHARIHLNSAGTLSTIADWQFDAASSGTAIAFGDLNGDGWLDLALGVANGPIHIFVNTTLPTGIEEGAAELPRGNGARLGAGPNPFRGDTTLRLSAGAPVRLDRIEILDLNGRTVGILDPDARAPRRQHAVRWTADGAALPGPGIYFARAIGRAADGSPIDETAKIVWLGR